MAAHNYIEIPLWAPRTLSEAELGTVRLLDAREVCARVSFSRAQVYEMMAEGRFPRPIKFAPGRRGAVRWPDIWISEWLKLTIECVVAATPQIGGGERAPPVAA